ncbi:MAG TPA: PilZ domain-containing protein [Polyangiaceae bacterium]
MPDRMPSQPDVEVDIEFEPDGALTSSRRMGARASTKFSVFLVAGERRFRARTVELSTTGVVLDFRYTERPPVDGLQTLELVVPGLGKPIRTLARAVRQVGKYDAFEFMSIRPVDRLSLAEHIDRERRLAGS